MRDVRGSNTTYKAGTTYNTKPVLLYDGGRLESLCLDRKDKETL